MRKIGYSLFFYLFFTVGMVASADSTVNQETAVSAVKGLNEVYTGSEIKPLERVMTENEQMDEGSSDLNYIKNESILPELRCDDVHLEKQVKAFIFNKITKQKTRSVREKRNRMLLLKNLHSFNEVAEDDIDIKKNFALGGALMYLKVNQKRTIYRMCVSAQNDSKQFKDVYLVIYPYLNYYKVLVSNLMRIPEDADEASFIYHW